MIDRMDESTKQELVERFRNYLDEISELPPPEDDALSVFAELAGLKAEVKRESRQVKEVLEQFKSVFATLEADNRALVRELDQLRAAQHTLSRETLRPLLLELLDLRDRLEAALRSATVQPRNLLERVRYRHKRLLDALREGQTMSMRRLDRILEAYHVRPVEAVNQPLDPHIMKVVEGEFQPDRPSGGVTSELRKGFFWDDELLRPSDVKVNKRESIHE